MTSLTRVTLTQTVLTTLFAVRSHKGRPASPDTNPHRLTARLQFLISIASGRSTIATATKIVKAMVPRACAVYNLDVEDTAPGKVTATTVNWPPAARQTNSVTGQDVTRCYHLM